LHLFVPVQVVPSLAAGFEQMPLFVSHVPATWQASLAVQTTGLAPAHVPFWHVSDWVQALPSLQLVPLVTAGFEQTPLVGSHAPARWHWSLATHTTGLEPVHVPLTHWSVSVQAFPSLHAVRSANVGFEHAPVVGSHVPAA
jgi:hypothetical protein